MKLLLDTHALVWALGAPRRLPKASAEAIRDPENDVYVSAVSTWEIAIKAALGKIVADAAQVAATFDDIGFAELPVTVAHTVRLRTLPSHHRDPFDRLLIAQAIENRLTLVSRDPAFDAYGVPTLWKS